MAEKNVIADTNTDVAGNMTIDELVAAFSVHADEFYRDSEGELTSSFSLYGLAGQRMFDLYGQTPVKKFGPRSLEVVKKKWWTMDFFAKPSTSISCIFAAYFVGVLHGSWFRKPSIAHCAVFPCCLRDGRPQRKRRSGTGAPCGNANRHKNDPTLSPRSCRHDPGTTLTATFRRECQRQVGQSCFQWRRRRHLPNGRTSRQTSRFCGRK